MQRYLQSKNSIAVFVLAMIIGASVAAEAATCQDPPNIIYILADDLGYGDLGCYGQQVIQTPNIDRLCKAGMKFTNHHSGSTVCAPSRASLLTGKHMGHCTVRGNGKKQNLKVGNTDVTIARLLKARGYHTCMIGKAGTGCNVEPGQPNRKGFDYFYGFNGHGAAHHYFPPSVFRNDQEVLFPNNKKHQGDTYIHDEFMKEIVAYLETQAKTEKPFFLHYAPLIPHASLIAPEEWVAKYRGKVGRERPTKGGSYAKCDEPKATYAGMVSRLDWEVGMIMNKLNELGIADNTLVMFASDNGPHSAGGNKIEWFNSNGQLRGGKRDLFEGGVRVPMIATWPGKIKPGSTTDHLSAFWDVLPTLCELVDVEPPKDVDGISFLPTLNDNPEKQRQHESFYRGYFVPNMVDPMGKTPAWLAGCAAAGGGAIVMTVAYDAFTGNFGWDTGKRAICAGLTGCFAGGFATLGPWAGCVAGAVSSYFNSVCQKWACGTGEPFTLNACEFGNVAFSSIAGCAGGAIDSEKLKGYFATVMGLMGVNIGIWGQNCSRFEDPVKPPTGQPIACKCWEDLFWYSWETTRCSGLASTCCSATCRAAGKKWWGGWESGWK